MIKTSILLNTIMRNDIWLCKVHMKYTDSWYISSDYLYIVIQLQMFCGFRFHWLVRRRNVSWSHFMILLNVFIGKSLFFDIVKADSHLIAAFKFFLVIIWVSNLKNWRLIVWSPKVRPLFSFDGKIVNRTLAIRRNLLKLSLRV